MWSGGLESTSLLYKALTETECKTHAHFIRIEERNTRRAYFETRAVERLYPRLSEIRFFEYSATSVDLTEMWGPVQTEDLCLLWASNLVNQLPAPVVQVWYGINRDDYQKPVLRERHRRRSLQQGFDFFYKDRFGKEVQFVTPQWNLTKEEIWLQLPERYRKLTHSCRSPLSTGRRCLRCEPCTYLNKIERKHNVGSR